MYEKDDTLSDDELESIVKNTVDDINLKKIMEDPSMKKILDDAESITGEYQKKMLADYRKVIKEENEILLDKIKLLLNK